jgi:hypothetical protein
MEQRTAPLRRELQLAGYPAGGGSGTVDPAPTCVEQRSSKTREISGRFAPVPWLARLNLHLAVASIPVLAISAHVFWLVSLRTVALFVLLPLVAALAMFVASRPDRSDRVILAGFLWGLLACAGYDALRLPTVYVAHWWSDFFPAVGGWAAGDNSNVIVGYLWRYVGDGGGIAVAFFVLAATLGAGAWSRRRIMGLALGYAVCPVWAGLVLTDLLAPAGRQLFPLSFTSLALALAGHLLYGVVLGFGYWTSRGLEADWPFHVADLPRPSAFRALSWARAGS